MAAAERTVVVTGASGFLGQHVCAQLIRRGFDVRGLVRTPSSVLPDGTVRVIVPDLLDRPALGHAMRGAGHVVHLAARVHVMQETAADPLVEFRRVNVEGTTAVLSEALQNGVPSFLFVSSVKAAAESSADTPLTDDVRPTPGDAYGLSKLEAERIVAERCAGTTTTPCIVRLPLVYGPGMKGNMRRLFDLVDRGYPLPFARIRNRRAFIYAGNAAAVVESVLRRPAMPPGPYFVSDEEDLSTAELVRRIARALGRPARLLPIPSAHIRAAGRAGDLLARVAPWPFRSAHAERLLDSLSLDVSRFRAAVDFVPPFSVDEGLVKTAAWYRTHVSATAVGTRASVVNPASR